MVRHSSRATNIIVSFLGSYWRAIGVRLFVEEIGIIHSEIFHSEIVGIAKQKYSFCGYSIKMTTKNNEIRRAILSQWISDELKVTCAFINKLINKK